MVHLEVHPDDFVYLPAGLLHALKKGSVVYEIQQATDVTSVFMIIMVKMQMAMNVNCI
ncbi:MAG: hypothetical protein V8R63_06805 [Thomasclavelia ramosa]